MDFARQTNFSQCGIRNSTNIHLTISQTIQQSILTFTGTNHLCFDIIPTERSNTKNTVKVVIFTRSRSANNHLFPFKVLKFFNLIRNSKNRISGIPLKNSAQILIRLFCKGFIATCVRLSSVNTVNQSNTKGALLH